MSAGAQARFVKDLRARAEKLDVQQLEFVALGAQIRTDVTNVKVVAKALLIPSIADNLAKLAVESI